MAINPTYNKIPETQSYPNKVENKEKNISTTHSIIGKNTINGAIFGMGAGVGDAIATLYSLKKEVKSALEKYNNATDNDKKEMIKKLKEEGTTLEEYNHYAKRILSGRALPLMMVTRGLFFGVLVGTICATVEVIRKNKTKNNTV